MSIKIPIFSYKNKFVKNLKTFRVEKDGIKKPNFWQKEALKTHKHKRFTISNVPTGAGKSLLVIFQGVEFIKQNPNTKIIISVPQNQIGYGYKYQKLLNYEWRISEEFFLTQTNNQNTNTLKLKEFLISDSNVAICSHATLVKSFKEIVEGLDYNSHIFIDEGHHIHAQDDVFSNQLGKVALECINTNIGLHILTGTFSRDDRLAIIPKGSEDLFSKYRLSMGDFLKNQKSFNTFDSSCVLAENGLNGNYIKVLDDVLTDKKTIIYLPHRNTLYSLPNKNEEVKRLISKIVNRDLKKEELIENENGVIEIFSNRLKKNIKIINLVDEKQREVKKNYIGDNVGDKADYLISLKMFEEGSNWVECEHSISIGPTGIGVSTQRNGRTLRDLPNGKFKNPKSTTILSYPANDKGEIDKESARAAINEYFTYIACSMIVEHNFNPIKYLNLVSKTEEQSQKISDKIINIGVTTNNLNEFLEKGREYLSSEGIDNNQDNLLKEFYAKHTARTKLVKDSHLLPNIDMIDKENAFGHILAFTSVFGFDKLSKVKEVLGYEEKAGLEEHIEFAKYANIKNGIQWKNHINKPINLYKNIFDSPNPIRAALLKFWGTNRIAFTEKEKLNIQEKFKNNITISEISRIYNCSEGKINRYLRSKGFDTRGRLNKDFMIGLTWTYLTVMSEDLTHKKYGKRYKCICKCGNYHIVSGQLLRNGQTKSCGCYNKEKSKIGKYFDILNPMGKRISGYNLEQYFKENNLKIIYPSKLNKILYHDKGYCLYHPKLVGTTHEERIEKGLYKKYIKLNK